MLGRIWVGVFTIPWWLGSVAHAAPQAVLDKPAFTATPNELLALGKAAAAGDWPVVILRDQTETSYDERSRATVRWRSVFVVRTQTAVEDWGTLRSPWRPSYQDKPVFRARVIDPSGNVAELDPSLITDAPVAGDSANMFSDRRNVDAPLPRLQIGAVVEEEVVTTDREPILLAGGVATSSFGNDVPTSTTVFGFSAPAAPASRKLHHAERKLPAGVRVRHQVTGGRESWIYEVSALPARTAVERAVPGDVVTSGYVGVSTAASWAAVAHGYRAVVDQRISDGPVPLPADLPRTASLATVDAITSWLHRQIRYTGIEFGDAALVPWPPAEVVKRGFGDCKDKATLLIALLRQAGIRADLALLLTGPGPDVDPDLPGMGVFDHAIVRARIEGRDLWIDATEDLMRPGQLPGADQGRQALVISDDTTGLSLTPAAVPTDNVFREVRTFTATETGGSQLTEVTRGTGVFDAELRAGMRGARADDLQKTYDEYATSRYGGALDRVTSSDPADLATAFERTVAVKDAARVFTSREQIDVYLFPRSTFHELPPEVAPSDDHRPPRVNDFAWFTPHVYEVENRIALPPGFTLPTVNPERTRAIGTASFTERRRIDGQSLIVTFRLDTGKSRLTAAELTALRSAIDALAKEDVHIEIAHTALALGHAGKPREAIAECQRLIALHPREAIHHSQLATVLLRAGAGEAARREARAAVALEPAAADPLVMLGWVLRFDTLGREFAYDWDRAGAIAALQKARKLDPAHAGAGVELAKVLQRDPSGRLYGPGADLRGAAEVWRAALALDKSDDNALALVQVLLWSGKFEDAEAVARSTAQTEVRDKWIIAAVAGASGAAPALQAAADLRSGASRAQVIDAAASALLLLQHYDVAREMFAQTGALTRQLSGDAASISKVTTHPPVKPGTADPRTAALDVLLAMVDAQRKTPVFWDRALEHSVRESDTAWLAPENLLALPFVEDLTQSSSAIQIEGGAGVWRAAIAAPGQQLQLYLALDRGVIKLIGTSETTSSIGRYVLRAGDAAGQARARKLLDWVRRDLDKDSSATAALIKRLWGPGFPSSPEAMQLVGAVLANTTDPDRALAIATRCATTLPDGELACHGVLHAVYFARGRWADAIAEIERIVALRPDREPAMMRVRAVTLARAGRCDDADKVADAMLAKDPDNQDALAVRFAIAVACGPPQEALRRSDAIVKPAQARPSELNNVAWYRLVTGEDLPLALDLARRAVAQTKDKDTYTPLSTLAAIEAETGELDHAIDDNWKAMALHRAPEPTAPDWYIIGRIYEQLGLVADAAVAYRRVTQQPGEVLTSHDLAQRRLAALPHK